MFFLTTLPNYNPMKRKLRSAHMLTKLSGRCANSSACLAHFRLFDKLFMLNGGSFFHPRFPQTLLTYTRTICKTNKTMASCWLNLPLDYIITKKAQNVRMGKGKGSRKGACAYQRAGTIFCALGGIRPGISNKVLRFLRARVSTHVLMLSGASGVIDTPLVRFGGDRYARLAQYPVNASPQPRTARVLSPVLKVAAMLTKVNRLKTRFFLKQLLQKTRWVPKTWRYRALRVRAPFFNFSWKPRRGLLRTVIFRGLKAQRKPALYVV